MARTSVERAAIASAFEEHEVVNAEVLAVRAVAVAASRDKDWRVCSGVRAIGSARLALTGTAKEGLRVRK